MPVQDQTEIFQIESPALNLLLDMEMPVSISFGRARLPLEQVLQLTIGSNIELDRAVGDQVDILVNECVVARGEVVMVDANYGVRVRQIMGQADRMRTVASSTPASTPGPEDRDGWRQ